jgi:hypothetical protein
VLPPTSITRAMSVSQAHGMFRTRMP